MSDKINVEEILRKHIPLLADSLKQANGTASKLQAAIKEIVEVVVDKCAENVNTTIYYGNDPDTKDDKYVFMYDNPNGPYEHICIDKQSILNVKQQVEYE